MHVNFNQLWFWHDWDLPVFNIFLSFLRVNRTFLVITKEINYDQHSLPQF